MTLETTITDHYREVRRRLHAKRTDEVASIIPPPAPGPLVEPSPDLALTPLIPKWWSVEGSDPIVPAISYIQQVVARHYEMTRTQLLADRRFKPIVRARHVAMYLAKTMTPRSLPEIGRRFGGRDHTTVIHAVRKVEADMAADEAFRAEVEMIRGKVMEGAE